MSRRTAAAALAAFLANLAETGNVRLAADRCGLARSGLFKRRRRDPDFARAWDAALYSSPGRGGGPPQAVEGAPSPAPRRGDTPPYRTRPGELVITAGPRPQLRRSGGGHLTAGGAAAFLATLARTANVRLSAAQVGLAASSIHRRRARDPAFAAAMDDALATGTAALEAALVEAALATLDPDAPPADEPPAVLPPASFMDAIRLLRVKRR